ncbi:MAG: AMP-binding protein [Actinomycetota bacterium]|nr:AMP-binding protein [Actinomycetota bacterium]
MLPHLIARRAAEQPDRTFLIDVAGGTRTWSQLHDNALRWAGALAELGIEPGDTVLSMQPTCFTPIESWIGIAWLRAIEVPVNTAYRGRMLSYLIENSQAEVMVCAARYLDRLVEVADDIAGRIRKLVVLEADGPLGDLSAVADEVMTAEELFARSAPASDLAGPEPWDIACIIYTSGTTGPSKGVLQPWAQVHAGASLMLPEADEHDVYYSPFPLFHVSGKGPIYFEAMVGGTVVLREQFDTGAFWKDIISHGCTSTLLLESMAQFVQSQPPQPGDADTPLQNVLMVPLVADIDAFRERFGVQVSTVFNMSEISCPIVSDGYELVNSRSCGRVRDGYHVRVVDEHDRPVAPGVLGELVVRSDEPWTLMAGYWAMPEKTVEAWRNQWLHTGDGFTYDEDGNFYFVDRRKDAIRRRGENISSFEVESEVNTHPAVSESAAIAVPSEFGEDEVKIVIVCRDGMTLDPAELVEYLRPRMPRFMIPRYIEVVDALPKTPTEKVRKAALRESGVNEHTWDRQAATTR